MLCHMHNQERILIEIRSMFERVDPRLNRLPDSIDAMRVGCHTLAELVGFLHQRADLIFIEMRDAGNAAFDEHSAGHSHLDHIRDRKSTRLNSSHSQISYAVFCLKKKKNIPTNYFI